MRSAERADCIDFESGSQRGNPGTPEEHQRVAALEGGAGRRPDQGRRAGSRNAVGDHDRGGIVRADRIIREIPVVFIKRLNPAVIIALRIQRRDHVRPDPDRGGLIAPDRRQGRAVGVTIDIHNRARAAEIDLGEQCGLIRGGRAGRRRDGAGGGVDDRAQAGVALDRIAVPVPGAQRDADRAGLDARIAQVPIIGERRAGLDRADLLPAVALVHDEVAVAEPAPGIGRVALQADGRGADRGLIGGGGDAGGGRDEIGPRLVAGGVVIRALSAEPGGFIHPARAAAVDRDVVEGDIDRIAPPGSGVGVDLEVQMVAGRIAGIVGDPQELAAVDPRPDRAERNRDAILRQVQVDLVGRRDGRGILEHQVVGVVAVAVVIAVRVGPDRVLDRAGAGGDDRPHRLGGVVEIVTEGHRGGVVHRLGQELGHAGRPGQVVAADRLGHRFLFGRGGRGELLLRIGGNQILRRLREDRIPILIRLERHNPIRGEAPPERDPRLGRDRFGRIGGAVGERREGPIAVGREEHLLHLDLIDIEGRHLGMPADPLADQLDDPGPILGRDRRTSAGRQLGGVAGRGRKEQRREAEEEDGWQASIGHSHEIWPELRPIPSREEGANCVPRGVYGDFPNEHYIMNLILHNRQGS